MPVLPAVRMFVLKFPEIEMSVAMLYGIDAKVGGRKENCGGGLEIYKTYSCILSTEIY